MSAAQLAYEISGALLVVAAFVTAYTARHTVTDREDLNR